mgnify:FL=1
MITLEPNGKFMARADVPGRESVAMHGHIKGGVFHVETMNGKPASQELVGTAPGVLRELHEALTKKYAGHVSGFVFPRAAK